MNMIADCAGMCYTFMVSQDKSGFLFLENQRDHNQIIVGKVPGMCFPLVLADSVGTRSGDFTFKEKMEIEIICNDEAIEKFNENIGILENGCWEWQGRRDSNGYGTMCQNPKNILAHRFSYTYFYGPIPNGFVVCHICDNPPCVNPDHLFIGTQADNIRDMYKKNRCHMRHGENHPSRKLNIEQVEMIRNIRAEYGYTYEKIAEQFNMSIAQIWRIVMNKHWSKETK